MVVENALFRGLLHINVAIKVVVVHLDIFAFLSSSYVPEVHSYRWKLLEGHLSCLVICLFDVHPIRKG